jgi:hypothetical protein
MADRHKPRPDYQRTYHRARAAADRRLRQAHRDEWTGYFEEERTK